MRFYDDINFNHFDTSFLSHTCLYLAGFDLCLSIGPVLLSTGPVTPHTGPVTIYTRPVPTNDVGY